MNTLKTMKITIILMVYLLFIDFITNYKFIGFDNIYHTIIAIIGSCVVSIDIQHYYDILYGKL